MTQQVDTHDSHAFWLQDTEYRKEFGAESAKLEMAAAFVHAREVMNMTQSELADRAGTSQAYISRLERGDANPTIGNIGRLFACMWLKPRIEPAPMEPFTSMESIIIEKRSDSEARIDFSGAYIPTSYSYRISE